MLLSFIPKSANFFRRRIERQYAHSVCMRAANSPRCYAFAYTTAWGICFLFISSRFCRARYKISSSTSLCAFFVYTNHLKKGRVRETCKVVFLIWKERKRLITSQTSFLRSTTKTKDTERVLIISAN